MTLTRKSSTGTGQQSLAFLACRYSRVKACCLSATEPNMLETQSNAVRPGCKCSVENNPWTELHRIARMIQDGNVRPNLRGYNPPSTHVKLVISGDIWWGKWWVGHPISLTSTFWHRTCNSRGSLTLEVQVVARCSTSVCMVHVSLEPMCIWYVSICY